MLPPKVPTPDTEPYPSELPKLHHVGEKLQRKFKNVIFDEVTMEAFMRAAVEMFGEVGFRVGVVWQQVVTSTGDWITLPSVTIQGRVHPEEETDHDRLKHEIVTGKADGQSGYIRADGTKREDPQKKTFT